jgi:hypothetical protein
MRGDARSHWAGPERCRGIDASGRGDACARSASSVSCCILRVVWYVGTTGAHSRPCAVRTEQVACAMYSAG